MAKRKRCVFYRREVATNEDWERNAALPSDREDEEAARLGLDKLCWEPEDDSCLAILADSGRPTNLASSLAQHDALYSAVQEEVERLRDEAGRCRGEAAKRRQKVTADLALGEGSAIDRRADRLQAILDRTSPQAGRER